MKSDVRTLQRELLLARAAAERAALAAQLDALRERTRSPRGVAGLLFAGARGAQRSGATRVLPLAFTVVRRQPWLLATLVGGGVKIARSRTLRLLVVAGALGAAAWWWLQRAELPPDASGVEPDDAVD